MEREPEQGLLRRRLPFLNRPSAFSPSRIRSDPAERNHPPPRDPRYQLLRRIGGGSYGEFWLARNIMGAGRAVKVIYRASFELERAFDREFNGVQKFVNLL
jgi:hypothetical protein